MPQLLGCSRLTRRGRTLVTAMAEHHTGSRTSAARRPPGPGHRLRRDRPRHMAPQPGLIRRETAEPRVTVGQREINQ